MTPYTRHQLIVLLVVLFAAGLGLAVGHWRRAHPALVERVEQLERRATTDAHEDPTAPRPKATKAASALVDLNHAGAAELVGLPGVGPALAARIVAAREATGPFAAVEDLRRVRGLRRQTIERLRALVRIVE